MGFKKPSLDEAGWDIRRCLEEIKSPRNDGFVQQDCKKHLYLLKCWLEDEYKTLPVFLDEPLWEQERLIDILKTKHTQSQD
jgi:hypothetical protein